jgi:hypothetical protein
MKPTYYQDSICSIICDALNLPSYSLPILKTAYRIMEVVMDVDTSTGGGSLKFDLGTLIKAACRGI